VALFSGAVLGARVVISQFYASGKINACCLVCTLLQTDNHASTSSLIFLLADA